MQVLVSHWGSTALTPMVRKGSWVACVGVRVGSKQWLLEVTGKESGWPGGRRESQQRVYRVQRSKETHIWGGREEIPMQRMARHRRRAQAETAEDSRARRHF